MKVHHLFILCALISGLFPEVDARDGRVGAHGRQITKARTQKRAKKPQRRQALQLQRRITRSARPQAPVRSTRQQAPRRPAQPHVRPAQPVRSPIRPSQRPSRPAGRPVSRPGIRPEKRPGHGPERPRTLPVRPGQRPGRPQRPGPRPGIPPGAKPNPDKPLRQDRYRTPQAMAHQKAFMNTKFDGHTWNDLFRHNPKVFSAIFPAVYKQYFGGYPPFYFDFIDANGFPPAPLSNISAILAGTAPVPYDETVPEGPEPEAYGPPPPPPYGYPPQPPLAPPPAPTGAWVSYAGPEQPETEQQNAQTEQPGEQEPAQIEEPYDYESEPVANLAPIGPEQTLLLPPTAPIAQSALQSAPQSAPQEENQGPASIKIIKPDYTKQKTATPGLATDVGTQEDIS